MLFALFKISKNSPNNNRSISLLKTVLIAICATLHFCHNQRTLLKKKLNNCKFITNEYLKAVDYIKGKLNNNNGIYNEQNPLYHSKRICIR